MTLVRTRLLDGFDDPTFGPQAWEELLQNSSASSIYLTWHFQRAWWESLGEGELLLIVAERDGQVVALAPLYTACGMVYFVGSAFDSDYLGFIGDLTDSEVLDALLITSRESVPDFLGFQFYFVPDSSGIEERLVETASRLGLDCYEEDDMPAPVIDLAGQPDVALKAASKKSLLKLERSFCREGTFDVVHLQDGHEIIPHLESFFEQHIARWAGTSTPSRFLDPKVRGLIETFTRIAAHTGWLRFTQLIWQGRPIAFHYGYCYRGRFFWGMPSFAADLARRSPGKLLIRHLLLAAIEEGASIFDFGTGAQPFKVQLATHINRVRTWGLYPTEAAQPGSGDGT